MNESQSGHLVPLRIPSVSAELFFNTVSRFSHVENRANSAKLLCRVADPEIEDPTHTKMTCQGFVW